MSRKIVITSGKGGVGKSTLTANLGKTLAGMGLRVALIDVDFGLNNLDVILGVENKITYDIVDVIEGRCRIKQALVDGSAGENLFILSSGNNISPNVTGQNLKLIIDSIDYLFDYIIIDCPAGVDLGFHRAVSIADEAIVVATPGLPSLRDADKVLSILKSYKMQKIYLVINRARGDLIINKKMMTPRDIEALLNVGLIGVLPEEDVVFLSCGGRLPNNSASKKAYKILANNIHKNAKKIYDTTNRYTGFLGSIRRSIKRSI